MFAAQLLINFLSLYAAVGCVFAVAFLLAGIERVDHTAVGSSIGFRLILFPGCAALWPVLLLRWLEVRR